MADEAHPPGGPGDAPRRPIRREGARVGVRPVLAALGQLPSRDLQDAPWLGASRVEEARAVEVVAHGSGVTGTAAAQKVF